MSFLKLRIILVKLCGPKIFHTIYFFLFSHLTLFLNRLFLQAMLCLKLLRFLEFILSFEPCLISRTISFLSLKEKNGNIQYCVSISCITVHRIKHFISKWNIFYILHLPKKTDLFQSFKISRVRRCSKYYNVTN